MDFEQWYDMTNLIKKFAKALKKKTERPVKIIGCPCCGLIFYLCSHCYRGHKYCSVQCRKSAQREAHREAQRRYRQTEKGKKAHRDSEKRRRLGKAGKGGFGLIAETLIECCKSAAEKVKLAIEELLEKPDAKAHCHRCHCRGKIVPKFDRSYVYKEKTKEKRLVV